MRARKTLTLVVPLVVLLIFGVLYLTYRDAAHAALILLAVPGALAGGVIFQWILDTNFSVAVWVGFVACFGMATETGIVMVVYLRESLHRARDEGRLTSIDAVRLAVIDGAVRRLRPKLLTELTTVLALAPMLWAVGPGADVIRPMAIPVIGGILVADEFIDLMLPVFFFRVERRRWMRRQAAAASPEAAR